ncbi:MAG: aminotransferase class III-fold pyridoxal phosphate-dependent enzyme [Hyphomicrobiaceae bacterium]
MDSQILTYLVAGAGAAGAAAAAARRLRLSGAKHPSLAGHARISTLIARLIPFYGFGEGRFFSSDGARPDVARRREMAFEALARDYEHRFVNTIALKAEIKDTVSDLQFTDVYRVPYQYSRLVRERLGGGPLLQSSHGVMLTDVDGNTYYDLAGSYGVNLFGYDFYKACIERAVARVGELGPVLGALHPIVAYNVKRLREISGLDEVSFHMSGTEAVMQAVRLARYHTGRRRIVRFCGAYHGWWGDVQPGVGNPMPARETYTLADMSEKSLRVLETRRDIACVLVNPSQAMHPNAPAPGDSALIDSSRRAGFDRAAYAAWLQRLREVCRRRGIILILDEIFVGFRLAPGGAQEYFGVRADIVTYGKSLGGGLPVGVVCGARCYMKRYRDDRPVDVCFARGTFNAHPYVMAAMHEFLLQMETPQIKALYAGLDDTWNVRTNELNHRLEARALPVRIANMSSIWTVFYTRPSRYNWMLQYYLRREGLALSWIGTGRLIFSLNYTAEDFEAVASRFVAAAEAMAQDGWWWEDDSEARRPSIKRQVLYEMLSHRFPIFAGVRR